PEDGPQQFGAAGPHHTGDAEYFALAKFQRRLARLGFAGQIVDAKDHFAGLALRSGVKVVDGAADHQRDDLPRRGRRRWAAADALAVAQNGEAVADLLYFFQEVGDVDDGVTVGLELADQGEEVVDVARRQAAGWF